MSKDFDEDDPRLVYCHEVLEKIKTGALKHLLFCGGFEFVKSASGELTINLAANWEKGFPDDPLLDDMKNVALHATRAEGALANEDIAGFAFWYGLALTAFMGGKAATGLAVLRGAIKGGKDKSLLKRDLKLAADYQAAVAIRAPGSPKLTVKQFARHAELTPDATRKAFARAKKATKRKSGK